MPTGRAFAQIDSARRHLAELPNCTGTVGVIGYCIGGFRTAAGGRVRILRGRGELRPVAEDLDDVLRGSCPMVAGYGARDTTLEGAAEKGPAEPEQRPVSSRTSKQYPDARHGLINRIAVASPLTVLMRVTGVGYDHRSAADAKRRILGFFDEHLRARDASDHGTVATELAPG